MIDIHSHILWGLDDGARSFDESLAMVRLAAAAGTTDIVATPHANLEYEFDSHLVSERIAELSAAAGPLPRIHRGCDFHFYPAHVDLAIQDPSKYTVNGKRYLLIEFSDLMIFKETPDLISRLQAAGIICILTHPERNFLLHPRIEDLAKWVEDGLLLQVTAQSLSGRFGAPVKKFAGELLHRGLVHFIASDAHDTKDRTPRLDEARRRIEREFGSEWAEHLFVYNPQAVLAGAPVPPLPKLPERRKWWKFGRR